MDLNTPTQTPAPDQVQPTPQTPQVPTPVQEQQVPVPVPRKPVVMLLVALIDSFRISAALAGYKNSLLTLLVLFQELVTGQWRQMIMTAVGLISPMGVAVGVVGKYIINAWMLINPTLRDELLRDMYKGSKSFLIGFLLWATSNLPPAVVKIPGHLFFLPQHLECLKDC